jgi:hypothetical protein
MSTFDIPTHNCSRLDAVARKFWWKGTNNANRFVAWKDWDKLCQPKKNGGLGFRRFKDFNKALLAKVGWMIAKDQDNLCTKLLKRAN